MLNSIVLMGRLTRDPELRHTGNGTPVATFTIAVDRDFSGKDGGEKETDFIDIVTWRNTAEFVSKHFTKGRMAVVNGRLQIRLWTDKDGNNRKTAEVVAEHVYFGDSKKEGNQAAGNHGQQPAYGGYDQGYGMQSNNNTMPTDNYTPPQSNYAMLEDDDDTLPF